ncbi:unnamed protein product, partial [Phaeothamnion confervicola]
SSSFPHTEIFSFNHQENALMSTQTHRNWARPSRPPLFKTQSAVEKEEEEEEQFDRGRCISDSAYEYSAPSDLVRRPRGAIRRGYFSVRHSEATVQASLADGENMRETAAAFRRGSDAEDDDEQDASPTEERRRMTSDSAVEYRQQGQNSPPSSSSDDSVPISRRNAGAEALLRPKPPQDRRSLSGQSARPAGTAFSGAGTARARAAGSIPEGNDDEEEDEEQDEDRGRMTTDSAVDYRQEGRHHVAVRRGRSSDGLMAGPLAGTSARTAPQNPGTPVTTAVASAAASAGIAAGAVASAAAWAKGETADYRPTRTVPPAAAPTRPPQPRSEAFSPPRIRGLGSSTSAAGLAATWRASAPVQAKVAELPSPDRSRGEESAASSAASAATVAALVISA